MAGPRRVSVQEARRRLQSGAPVLLVCAYPRATYDESHLEGAIAREDFEARAASLPKDHEVVFY